jgi:hypothetical protein
MISVLIYAGNDFHSAMHIINTCGWDTDCNSGNVGCLVAIMHGLAAFEDGPDWRGPLADRALISSADGGYSVNNAVKIAYDVADLGHTLAGEAPLSPPKEGAQFHFTLPGSVQGFIASRNELLPSLVKIQQAVDDNNRPSLEIHLSGLTDAIEPVEVLTQTFTPSEIVKMKTYDLMAAPLVSPGQTITAILRADKSNKKAISANLRLKHYNAYDTLSSFDGPSIALSPGEDQTLTWKIPDAFDGQPIQQFGLALSSPKGHLNGTVWLDSVSYTGTPHTTLKRPAAAPIAMGPSDKTKPCDFWRRAWISNLSTFHPNFSGASFFLAHDRGEGLLITGTREWTDYKVTVPSFKINIGSAGLVVRNQGLNRYYALIFKSDRKSVALVKARDELRTELASESFEWRLDEAYTVAVHVEGNKITGFIAGETVVESYDDEYVGGGIGAVVIDGGIAITQFDIAPL